MSKISTVYDAMYTLLSSNLTGYTQIPNPYNSEQNSMLFLNKGYGLVVGTGDNTQRFATCDKKSYAREFTIVLVNQYIATEHDTDAKETAEKALLEDHATLITAIEQDADLGGNAATHLSISDGGIDFLEGDREKYIMLELIVNVEYFENI